VREDAVVREGIAVCQYRFGRDPVTAKERVTAAADGAGDEAAGVPEKDGVGDVGENLLPDLRWEEG